MMCKLSSRGWGALELTSPIDPSIFASCLSGTCFFSVRACKIIPRRLSEEMTHAIIILLGTVALTGVLTKDDYRELDTNGSPAFEYESSPALQEVTSQQYFTQTAWVKDGDRWQRILEPFDIITRFDDANISITATIRSGRVVGPPNRSVVNGKVTYIWSIQAPTLGGPPTTLSKIDEFIGHDHNAVLVMNDGDTPPMYNTVVWKWKPPEVEEPPGGGG